MWFLHFTHSLFLSYVHLFHSFFTVEAIYSTQSIPQSTSGAFSFRFLRQGQGPRRDGGPASADAGRVVVVVVVPRRGAERVAPPPAPPSPAPPRRPGWAGVEVVVVDGGRQRGDVNRASPPLLPPRVGRRPRPRPAVRGSAGAGAAARCALLRAGVAHVAPVAAAAGVAGAGPGAGRRGRERGGDRPLAHLAGDHDAAPADGDLGGEHADGHDAQHVQHQQARVSTRTRTHVHVHARSA